MYTYLTQKDVRFKRNNERSEFKTKEIATVWKMSVNDWYLCHHHPFVKRSVDNKGIIA